MQTSKLFVAFVICLISFPTLADLTIEQLPKGAQASLLIESLNQQQVIYDTQNTDVYFPPASTLKLVTALAAKLELGDDCHETKLNK